MNLRVRAGQELDPVVVAAAVRTVDDEIIELGSADAQPAPAAMAPSRSSASSSRPAARSRSTRSRQQRGQLGPLGAGVLRPPVRERLGASDDHLRQLLELRACEAVAGRAWIGRQQVGERAGRPGAQTPLILGQLGVAHMEGEHPPGVGAVGHVLEERVDRALESLAGRHRKHQQPSSGGPGGSRRCGRRPRDTAPPSCGSADRSALPTRPRSWPAQRCARRRSHARQMRATSVQGCFRGALHR